MSKRLLTILILWAIILTVYPIDVFAVQRYEILKIGDEDEYVTALQKKLLEIGYFHGNVTGYFGTVTQQALMDYQNEHGLTVDGKAGHETLTSLMGSDFTLPANRFGSDDKPDSYCLRDKGDIIRDIQQKLMDLEYYDYSNITGYFGPVTERAIRRFQRTNGLCTDGIAGPKTLSLLFSGNAKSFCIYPGDRGADVKALQQRLYKLGYYTYDKITGYFGTATEHALKEFQAQNGLAVDAKAGKNTRALLYSSDAPEWDCIDRVSGNNADSVTVSPVDKMLEFSGRQLGKEYAYSTEGPSTFDSSGLVYYVLKYIGISTSRLSASGFSEVDSWIKIDYLSSLQPGDLLFFKSDSSSRISHTGIYIGNGEFISASSSDRCVKVSTMTGYYDRNFALARRVF